MRVLIVDPHPIYRRGLVTCLSQQDHVVAVDEAPDVPSAQAGPVAEADVVVLDGELPGVLSFLRQARQSGTRVVVCAESIEQREILACVQAGAVGYLRKDTLTSDTLVAAVRAAAQGAGVMPPELLGTLLDGINRIAAEVLEPRGLSLSRLTPREQRVLSLIADGHPTREVARELCYSERTVKNVIHDVVTKLNARTRSQAVALALREGLI